MTAPVEPLSELIKKLDVLCEVINISLLNRRVTRHDLILLRDASQRVVEAYQRETPGAKLDC